MSIKYNDFYVKWVEKFNKTGPRSVTKGNFWDNCRNTENLVSKDMFSLGL